MKSVVIESCGYRKFQWRIVDSLYSCQSKTIIMANKYFMKALAEVKPETKIFVKKNLDISEQVQDILKRKNLTQKDLAKLLGKTEPEVSRMLSGLHNLTLKTLAKLEAALGEDVITTPLKEKNKWGFDSPTIAAKVVTYKSRQIVKRSRQKYHVSSELSSDMKSYIKDERAFLDKKISVVVN